MPFLHEIIFVIVIGGLIILFRILRPTSTQIGKAGERHVSRILKKAFKKEYGFIFNDALILHRGKTTQIDHIAINQHGIFVIETKNLKGWIFGYERSRQWNQNIFGERYYFRNPVHQNYGHVKVLEDIVGMTKPFVSLVVFTGDCEFKTNVPYNVIYSEFLIYKLHTYSEIILNHEQIDIAARRIQSKIIANSRANRKAHIRSITKS